MKAKRELFYSKLSTCDKPMRYFQFKIFVQIPLGILYAISNFIIYNLDSSAYANEATAESTAISFVYTIIVVISLIFMRRGLYAFAKYGVAIIYIHNIFTTFFNLICTILSWNVWNSYSASFVSSAIFLFTEFIYFQKRKYLFDNERIKHINNVNISLMHKISEEKSYYCKCCGAKSGNGDIKCHSCGKRLKFFALPKFSKSKLKPTIVSLVIITLCGICIWQRVELVKLNDMSEAQLSYIRELRSEVDGLSNANDLVQKNNNILEKDNATLEHENGKLQNSNDILKSENRNLREKNNMLTSINTQLSAKENTYTQTPTIQNNNNSSTVLYDEGAFGEYYVKIKAASLSKDYLYRDIIIVTLEWTNNSQSDTYYASIFKDMAYQDGAECETGYIGLGVTDFVHKKIKPGATYEVQIAFKLNNKTTDVDVEIFNYDDLFDTNRKYVTKTFSIK